MNTTQILTNVKKECWEFKSHVFWIPIVIVGVFLIGQIWSLFNVEGYQFERLFNFLKEMSEASDVTSLGKASLVAMFAIFTPFLTVALFVQLHYFISCMFDERRDLSIYFWRSLPVSDLQSVLVKLFTGAFVIPGSFLLAATVLFIFTLVIALIVTIVLGLGYDVSLWTAWSNTRIISGLLFAWFSLIPIALWMFPAYAYLMLASSFANRAPFLWATLPIVILVIGEVALNEALGRHDFFFINMLQQYFTIHEDSAYVNQVVDRATDSVHLTEVLKVLWGKVTAFGTVMGLGFLGFAYWLRTTRK